MNTSEGGFPGGRGVSLRRSLPLDDVGGEGPGGAHEAEDGGAVANLLAEDGEGLPDELKAAHVERVHLLELWRRGRRGGRGDDKSRRASARRRRGVQASIRFECVRAREGQRSLL